MTGEATAPMLTEPCGTATASDTTAGSATAKTSAEVPTDVEVHGDTSSARPCRALRMGIAAVRGVCGEGSFSLPCCLLRPMSFVSASPRPRSGAADTREPAPAQEALPRRRQNDAGKARVS